MNKSCNSNSSNSCSPHTDSQNRYSRSLWMFAAVVFFSHTNVNLYMLFDIFVCFTEKENIEDEQNFFPGRGHSPTFHRPAILQKVQ